MFSDKLQNASKTVYYIGLKDLYNSDNIYMLYDTDENYQDRKKYSKVCAITQKQIEIAEYVDTHRECCEKILDFT